MPADTESVSLGLKLQGTGNNDNSWGDILNTQVIQYIEDALVGTTSVVTTGGATTLTLAECRPKNIIVTGTLSSDAVITVPNTKNSWTIFNGCAGSFAVQFKADGGTTPVTIPANSFKDVITLGDTGIYRIDREKIGVIFFHASSAPAGAVECDGAAISRTGIGADLFNVIGTTWGVGNGINTFNVPDGKSAGRFIRARSGSVGVGTYQSELIANHTHPLAGSGASATFSGTTSGISANHTHTYSGTTSGQSVDHTHSSNTAANKGLNRGTTAPTDAWGAGDTGTDTSGASADHSHTYSGTSSTESVDHSHTYSGSCSISGNTSTNTSGGAETRPINLSGVMCIWL